MRRYLLIALLVYLLVLLVDDKEWLERWIRRLGYDGSHISVTLGPWLMFREVGMSKEDVEKFVYEAARGGRVVVAPDVHVQMTLFENDHKRCLDGVVIEESGLLPRGSAFIVRFNTITPELK